MAVVSCNEYYSIDDNLRKLADFLASTIRTRSAIEQDKRVLYFKGKRYMELMLASSGWPRNLMQPTSEIEAIEIGTRLLTKHYFHQSERVEDKRIPQNELKNHLKISPVTAQVKFNPNAYFTWMYQGNVASARIKSILVVAVILSLILFPVWPLAVRKIIWYITCTLMLVILGFIAIRLAFYTLFWVLGLEIWIFPNLFDENSGVTASFSPIIAYEFGNPGSAFFRIAALGLLIATGYYTSQASSEDIKYVIDAQKKLVDDLYEGKLMTSTAGAQAPAKIYPSISDLLKEEEELLRQEREANEAEKHHETFEMHGEHNLDDVLDAMLEEDDIKNEEE